ncbi:MAG TPA: phosphoglucomutase/phosphomannomutase family protein [Oscillatoriales cyanobacterium M59_W2019_021]|nr:phosphoglucomutase/phosphomannomutase family protein [Oscillatoriales cyanobacterium M4454_W2019_049]HIK49531.1 phosphoglucomutase/phosphomannomutase family protein [Oscillatoriales cyanobacterium M59_W2019_021]
MTQPSVFPTTPNPIKFGTDGWRGVIAADFTFDRVARVAVAAARVLARVYGDTAEHSNLVIVGYDRRFMAEHFARTAADTLQKAGFDVLLADGYASTPAFSWAAHHRQALGAIVMTASHNPGVYLGLKVKGGFGGSVSPEVTQQIETELANEETPTVEKTGTLETFDPWTEFCADLRSKVDIDGIREAIASGKLTVFADVMHGAAAGGLEKILQMPITELNSDRDPLFEGGAPEPLPRYLQGLCNRLKTHGESGGGLAVGLAFDGDGDRIAAADGQGNFLSSQVLIPILLEHLTQRRGFKGEIIKTISGSDLIPRIAKLYDLPLYETAIGYKYIADRMLAENSLLGGEESGGIGYSTHIPERDALLSALYVMEAVVQSGQDLGELYRNLQEKANFTSEYDRIDLPLASMDVRSRLVEQLDTAPPTEIAGQSVTDCLTIDGYKFRLADESWILIRFSGTEPVLRLYSEAATMQRVRENLAWAKDWANSI